MSFKYLWQHVFFITYNYITWIIFSVIFKIIYNTRPQYMQMESLVVEILTGNNFLTTFYQYTAEDNWTQRRYTFNLHHLICSKYQPLIPIS